MDWPFPKSVTEVCSFYGQATFYQRFIRDFGRLATFITNCLKERQFHWGPAQQESFEILKTKLTTAPVLAFLNLISCSKLKQMRLRLMLVLSSCRKNNQWSFTAKNYMKHNKNGLHMNKNYMLFLKLSSSGSTTYMTRHLFYEVTIKHCNFLRPRNLLKLCILSGYSL